MSLPLSSSGSRLFRGDEPLRRAPWPGQRSEWPAMIPGSVGTANWSGGTPPIGSVGQPWMSAAAAARARPVRLAVRFARDPRAGARRAAVLARFRADDFRADFAVAFFFAIAHLLSRVDARRPGERTHAIRRNLSRNFTPVCTKTDPDGRLTSAVQGVTGGQYSEGSIRAQAFSFKFSGCSPLLVTNQVLESCGSVARVAQNARRWSRVR